MSTLSSIGSTSALTSPATSSSTTGSGSSSTGTLSVGGLISGLNTNQLIQGLLAVQQAQITQVQARQAAVTQKETAYKSLQASLLNFQASVTQLAQPGNGPFDGRTATSSDTTVAGAAASSNAVAGIYSFTVNSLAQANEIASAGFASATSQISQGTYTVGSGSSSATITVDSTNDTLQGLASAINAANGGVSASVVNDGSSHPYRLLLTANQTGTANAIKVTTPDDGNASPPATALLPNTTIVQAATDASITLGSTGNGGSGLTLTNSSNTINNVINGVTLNLVKPGAAQVTVAADTATAKTAIQGFVTAYNSAISAIDSDVSYDAQTNTAGVLLGDPSILGIEDKLRSLVTAPVSGANPKLNSLSALGITTNSSGRLQINDSQLTKVLSGQASGVSLTDVRNLFAFAGQSTNPGVAFANATSATKPGAYGVVVTQAALPAAVSGDGAPALNLSSGTTSFTLTLNGRASAPITVPAQNYASSAALVQAIQTQVNADSAVGGQVTVGLSGNNSLTFTTAGYGSSTSLAIASLAAGSLSSLGFNGNKSGSGQDVAGSFQVKGTTEAATGSGTLLTGKSGNANTDGLAVNVTLTAGQVTAAAGSPVANVSTSQGLAGQLGAALNSLLDPSTGQLQIIDQNFQDQINAYQTTINQLNQAYTQKQSQLTTEFTNLESTLSTLKNAGGFLSAQTSALQQFSGSGSSGKSG